MRKTALLTAVVAMTVLGGVAHPALAHGDDQKALGWGHTFHTNQFWFQAYKDGDGGWGTFKYESATFTLFCKGYDVVRIKDGDHGKDALLVSTYCRAGDGSEGYRLWVDAIDRGCGGSNDSIKVRVVDSEGVRVVVDQGGRIKDGDIIVEP